MSKDILYWGSATISCLLFFYKMDWYKGNPDEMDFKAMGQLKRALIKDGWKKQKGFTWTRTTTYHRVPLLNFWPFKNILVRRRFKE